MSKKFLQFIVILLAILIIFCFAALIYGMYLKISKNQINSENASKSYYLKLEDDEKIIDIQNINDQSILFIVSDSIDIYAIIFDTKNNKIHSKIKR